MPTALSGDVTQAELWQEADRRRLVRLCAAITGDRDAAEDLAQETLLEAWRNLHKLHDPAGAEQWLSAIARNVCLRWGRARGRDFAIPTGNLEMPDDESVDIEVELERTELAELLDRALALLPPITREVLVERYVQESPHAEIAARLGLSADAVSMRISRGKLALRRLLDAELRAEAAANHLPVEPDDRWRETRVWCTECGRHKLLIRRTASPRAVAFRCAGCHQDPATLSAEFRLTNPVFTRLIGDLVRPASMVKRVSEWSAGYFAGEVARVPCTWCGRCAQLAPYVRDDLHDDAPTSRRGLVATCSHCGEQANSSIGAIALAQLDVRRFRRKHPRMRALPSHEVEVGGVPALVVRYEDVLGSAGVDVVLARDNLRVLEVSGATG